MQSTFRSSAFLAAGLFLLASRTWAAACCGGGSLFPALVTGDESARITMGLSMERVVADANPSGIVSSRSSDRKSTIGSLNLDAAAVVYEGWQAGLEIPLVRNAFSSPSLSESQIAFGDLRAHIAYEFLPERTYSSWRPKGFTFLRLTAPTGTSIHESTSTSAVDITGKGRWNVAAGVALLKAWKAWDVALSFETHVGLPRTFETGSATAMRLGSVVGMSALAGVGWSPMRSGLRIGLAISPLIDGGFDVTELSTTRSAFTRVWNSSFQVSYLLGEWMTGLTYTDQTLLGGASNSPLSRSVSVVFQKRFPL